MLSQINKLNKLVFQAVSWLCVALIAAIIVEVLLRLPPLRYSHAWMGEIQWQLFALIFLFGSPYALKQGRHVRVDLFYERFGARNKAWVDLIGSLLFLLPWCAMLIWFCTGFAYQAWLVGERSSDAVLISYVPIKVALPLAILLLFLQACAEAVKAWQTLRSHSNKERA
ncbi:MAG: TRAP transporter small permease subunit [Bacteroidota bacterium]